MTEFLLLVVAGVLAGALNAVAGGGTFLTFPALVWLGVAPIEANATATAGAMAGYITSTWAFRGDMRAQMRGGAMGPTLAAACLGAMIGAVLLILTPADLFRFVVPWLLLLATLLFAAGPRLVKALQHRGIGAAGPEVTFLVILAVSIYGGYFNGGLGIMLLAAFSLLGQTNLHAMNGMKNLLSVILSLIAVATFAVGGLIEPGPGLTIAAASAVGGYAGAHWSRRIRRTDLLRVGIVAIGAVLTLAFFLA